MTAEEEETKLNSQEIIDIKEDSFSDDSHIIEQIMDKYGYGPKMFLQIFLFFSFALIDGVVMTMFGFLVIPLKKLFSLTDTQIELISGSMFVGVGIGSVSSGYLTSLYKRTNVLKAAIFLLCLFQLGMGLSHNIIFFTVFRFCTGFLNGVQIPVASSLIVEYLPVRLRVFTLCFCWMGFGVGMLITLGMMLYVMPNLEEEKTYDTILLSSIQILMVFIFIYVYVRDSPRNMILKNQEEEAFRVLEEFHGRPLSLHSQAKIASQVLSGVNNNQSGELKEIFGDKFISTTIPLSLLWFSLCIVLYGPSLILTMTLKSIGQHSDKSNHDVIINQMIILIPGLFFSIIAGCLSESQTLGRKMSTILCLVVGLVILITSCLFPTIFSSLFGISMSLFNVSFTIITNYTMEVYPTKLRSHGLGFGYLSGRLGGVVSQILYLYLAKIQTFAPYYFTAFLVLCIIILAYSLPYETCGKALDIDLEEEKAKNKNK